MMNINGLYRPTAELQAGPVGMMAKVGEFAPPQGTVNIASAAVHPLGHGILIRTFEYLYYYALNGPDESLGAALTRTPCAMPAAIEVQGEAVSWNRAGDGYVTASEGPGSTLNHASCDVD
jgi:hypothetical protein